jgi:hypothetical protein
MLCSQRFKTTSVEIESLDCARLSKQTWENLEEILATIRTQGAAGLEFEIIASG